MKTSGLNTTELGAYCWERVLVAEQVERWHQSAQDAKVQPLLIMADQKTLQKRHQEV
jgi:hypothetical protein